MKKYPFILVFAISVILSLLVLSVLLDLRHLPSIESLGKTNPKSTALMDQRAREARRKGKPFSPVHRFVPYGSISPHLKHAVLVAEDAAFFSHSGIDYEEMKEAIKADWRKKRFARGASTITMQLCKNLYLSTSKSPVRKLSEFILAKRTDAVLSKTRVFELYLNYIEWGDGLFGCQAASQAYFGCSSSDLTPEQAIRLASIIINPRRWGPYSDTKRMNKRRRHLADRMFDAGYLTTEEYLALPF
jgi:monofunctional biosynthetic peptidoglycan transglycosylase